MNINLDTCDLSDLTPAQQRAALDGMTQDKLIDLCVQALSEARMWREQAEDAHRRRITAMVKAGVYA